MAEITLAAETGRPTGSSSSRRLRATGRVPAVLYGRGMDPLSLAVDWRELRSALVTDKGLSALITLSVDGKSYKVIVKEMQRHPVRRDVVHLDFLAVDVTKVLAIDVPLVIEGEPEKVLREQGVVEHLQSTLVVNAKPDDIPGHIVIDVTDLDIGDVITVGDLPLPAGVTTDVDPEEAVVTAKLTSLALTTEGEEEEVEGVEGEDAAAEAGEGEAAEGGAAEGADQEGGE